MFKFVESVDKLLEIEETPSKSLERDIIAGLIVVINVVAIGIYPIYRMVVVAFGHKAGVFLSQLHFSLRDRVQNLRGFSLYHDDIQRESEILLKEARKLEYPPELISHRNHHTAPAPRSALLKPVEISTGTISDPWSSSHISGQIVFEIEREESYEREKSYRV